MYVVVSSLATTGRTDCLGVFKNKDTAIGASISDSVERTTKIKMDVDLLTFKLSTDSENKSHGSVDVYYNNELYMNYLLLWVNNNNVGV